MLFCLFVFTGDIIVDAMVIDEGWMEGRAKRTGKYGMLPSNYVERKQPEPLLLLLVTPVTHAHM